MSARNGDCVPPEKARPNYALPLLLVAIFASDTPGNEIDEAVVFNLVQGYLRGDPIPPITVYREGEKYRILFGHHRVEAARRAGLAEIMAIVLEKEPSALEKAVLQFRENNNRKTLTPLEMAALILRAMEAERQTAKQVAKLFGISEATVSKCLAIHKNLHDALKALVTTLEMTPRVAYALARLPLDSQPAFWERHKAESIDWIEEAVTREMLKAKGEAPKEKPVSVTVGKVKLTLPASIEQTQLDLAKVQKALKLMAEKHAPMSDLPVFLRMIQP